MRAQSFAALAVLVLLAAGGALTTAADGAMSDLGLPAGAAARLLAGEAAPLALPEGTWALRAAPRAILTDDATLTLLSADGRASEAPRAPLTTFVGRIEGREDLSVRLSIRHDGHVEGLVLDATGAGFLLLARPDGGADARPLLAQDHEAMGEDGIPPPGLPLPERDPLPLTQDRLVARLALHTDHNLWRNNQLTWQQNALELVNYAEAVYLGQLNVELTVRSMTAWTVPDPFTANNVCPADWAPTFKLAQFAAHMETLHPRPHEAAHLLIGRTSYTGNTIGCAYIGQLGPGTYHYGVSRVLTGMGRMGADTYDNVNVFAHELGHNFDGWHQRSLGTYGLAGGLTSSAPPYTIMNPVAVRGALRFSELDGVHSPLTGHELDNAGAMRSYAQATLPKAGTVQ